VAQIFICCGNVFGDDVHHELAGAADVAGRVLGDKAVAGPVGDADADDGRVGAEVVVGAEGRGIQPAALVHAGDERNGARRNQAYQQLVGVAAGDVSRSNS
jgi:hypothetical protein